MKYALAFLMIGLFSLSALARMPGPDNMLAHLTSTLDLTAGQAEQVEAIITGKQEKMQKLMQQMAALRAETDTAIKAVLNEEQLKKFETLQRNRPQRGQRPQEF